MTRSSKKKPNRTTAEIKAGYRQSLRDEDLKTRKGQRAALDTLLRCKEPRLGGLTPARAVALQLALKTPKPLPDTNEEIAADRQRRETAMAEINEALSKPPPKELTPGEQLRATKPKIEVRQSGRPKPADWKKPKAVPGDPAHLQSTTPKKKRPTRRDETPTEKAARQASKRSFTREEYEEIGRKRSKREEEDNPEWTGETMEELDRDAALSQ